MRTKTISGHIGTTYSLAHNNRDLISNNVDPNRCRNNYTPVMAGHVVSPDCPCIGTIPELWKSYRALTELYWSVNAIYREELEQPIQEYLDNLYALRRLLYQPSGDIVSAFFTLLLLPLTIAADIVISKQIEDTKMELQLTQFERKLSQKLFREHRLSLRNALWEYDRETGTNLLTKMDRFVWQTTIGLTTSNSFNAISPVEQPHYATIEQIYEKVFEPSFQDFQSRQRPCRRYHGTYLDQIRENRHNELNHSRDYRQHHVAEAIEILFSVGDMKNTGYQACPEDAAKSEALLKDFCNRLIASKHICIVTTRELQDPDWKPPFKNGLILLNLTAHFDEATPGIHMTVIPYSSGCKRGPSCQPSLNRAMTGMGYPSTWQEILDENGNPIPKRDRNGNIIKNKDGSIRYQKEAVQQGVLDWIEEQKCWIQSEMKARYGWEREYKGAHPRGYLDVPAYKAACAKEELERLQILHQQSIHQYLAQVDQITAMLDSHVHAYLQESEESDLLARYIQDCSQAEYDQLLQQAYAYFDRLPSVERTQTIAAFETLLADAKRRAAKPSDPNNQHSKTYHDR